MDRKGAVRRTKFIETTEKERKMFRFIQCDLGEVGKELMRKGRVGWAKTSNRVPSATDVNERLSFVYDGDTHARSILGKSKSSL